MDVGMNCRAEGGGHVDREGGGEQRDAVDGACHSSDACCAQVAETFHLSWIFEACSASWLRGVVSFVALCGTGMFPHCGDAQYMNFICRGTSLWSRVGLKLIL